MMKDANAPAARAAVLKNLAGKNDEELGEALGRALRASRVPLLVGTSALARAVLRDLRGPRPVADDDLLLASPCPFPIPPAGGAR